MEGSPLSLAWYSKAHLDSSPERILNGFLSTNERHRVSSVLTIDLTSAAPTSYEGYRYFCRVMFANGTLLAESQEVYLFPRDPIMNVLEYDICDEGSVQSTQLEDCVDSNHQRITTTTIPPPPPPTTPPPLSLIHI